MQIRCQNHTFPAHRIVVCGQSPPIDDEFASGDSSVTRVLRIDIHPPTTVLRFLQFLYMGNYDDEGHTVTDGPTYTAVLSTQAIEDALIRGTDPSRNIPPTLPARRLDMFLPLQLYLLATQYQVPGLRLLARDRFYRAASSGWRNPGTSFAAVIDELYASTDQDDVLRRDVCLMLETEYADGRAELLPILRSNGELAVQLLDLVCLRRGYEGAADGPRHLPEREV
jgi:hypothetical protein